MQRLMWFLNSGFIQIVKQRVFQQNAQPVFFSSLFRMPYTYMYEMMFKYSSSKLYR